MANTQVKTRQFDYLDFNCVLTLVPFLGAGSETLTIMRRSSSKRKSQRAGAGTPSVTELDDSALERHVGIVEDETPMEIASATVPSSEICENASLR